MIAALVFAREGFKVTCVEAAPKPTKSAAQDLRSTAFLMPSIRLLDEAGILSGLQDIAAPLRLMRIVDAGGAEPLPRETVDFNADAAGEEQFGWNIPNAPLRDKLLLQIKDNQLITMIFDDVVDGITTRMTGAIVRLKSGAQINAHLGVAADGRHSKLRDLAGINVTTLRYGQKALVADVAGRLSLCGKRGIWPIISQYAERLTGQRLALIGEAAHVVPPIGAQGLNMSLSDIAALRDLIANVSDRADIGEDRLLNQFQQKRWLDMRTRVQGIDALNRASMADLQPLRDIRSSLLSMLDKTPGLRRTAIKAGLGQ